MKHKKFAKSCVHIFLKAVYGCQKAKRSRRKTHFADSKNRYPILFPDLDSAAKAESFNFRPRGVSVQNLKLDLDESF